MPTDLRAVSPLGRTAADIERGDLTCKVTWDPIGPEQYCEYRCQPSGQWASSHFSADILRGMRSKCFGAYLQKWRDIAALKEDCGAAARKLATAGPPRWLADPQGLPLPDGETHVDKLWFMSAGAGRAGITSASLKGSKMTPENRNRLAQLHREIYEFHSSGDRAAVPACDPDAFKDCSGEVRKHLRWLRQKFGPMASAPAGVASGGSGDAMTQPWSQSLIGQRIPAKYRQLSASATASVPLQRQNASVVKEPPTRPAPGMQVTQNGERQECTVATISPARVLRSLTFLAAVAGVVWLFRVVRGGAVRPGARRDLRAGGGLSMTRGAAATLAQGENSSLVAEFLHMKVGWGRR